MWYFFQNVNNRPIFMSSGAKIITDLKNANRKKETRVRKRLNHRVHLVAGRKTCILLSFSIKGVLV